MVGKPLLIPSLSVHIDTVLINMDIFPLLPVIYMDAVPAYMNLAVLILYMHAAKSNMHILILITVRMCSPFIKTLFFFIVTFHSVFFIRRNGNFILCL